MKRFYKIFILLCFFVFSLLFLTSKGYSYYGGFPSGYSYTSQSYPYSGSYPTTSQYQPVYPYSGSYPTTGSYPMAYNYYPSGYGYSPPLYPSGVIGGTNPYGNQGMTYLPPTPESIKAATAKFSFINSTADENYIYVAFNETKGISRGALAILRASGVDDCEYVSHITLCEGTYGGLPPTPEKIVIKDNLAVIGAMDGGMIYLVDISNKMEPEFIDKLILGKEYQQKSGRNGVTDFAIEDNVLFVSIEFLGSDKNIIYSLDISDPKKMNVNDDLLGSYTLNDDNRISNMTSAPGYLYVYTDHTLLIIDTSDPKNLFPVKTLDIDGYEIGVEVNGDSLFATAVYYKEGDTSWFAEDSASKLKIINIIDPENPEIISSSDEFAGQQIISKENIVIKDNYAYVATSVITRVVTNNGLLSKSQIYVFDISKPKSPDLVKTSQSVDGFGLNLYLVGERLCLHTMQTLNIFDISNPVDISVAETVDIHKILEDELDGWGVTGDIIPEPPPSLYGGYGPYPSPPSLYSGYSPYGPYPLMGGIYGGYGSLKPPIPTPTLMPESTIYIGEVNIEGGLHIDELYIGGKSSPWLNTGASYGFSSPFINSYIAQPQPVDPYRTQFTANFTTPLSPPQGPYETGDDDAQRDYYADQVAVDSVSMKTITKDDNGKTITLQVGDKIEIVLPVKNDGEWRKKGYVWDSDVIKEIYTFAPWRQTNTFTQLIEFPVKTYEAKAKGEYELVLEYFSRSNPNEILDTFSLLIKVE